MLYENVEQPIPLTIQAMVLEYPHTPLALRTLPVPTAGPGQVPAEVIACGVCRTDLHIADAELRQPKLPLVPGHEIVTMVMDMGEGVTLFKKGDMIGIPWLGYTCGICRYCQSGRENICEQALFTGYNIDGGFAEFTVADEHYCFLLPAAYANTSGAPLMCTGLIGYRAYQRVEKAGKKLACWDCTDLTRLRISLPRLPSLKEKEFLPLPVRAMRLRSNLH